MQMISEVFLKNQSCSQKRNTKRKLQRQQEPLYLVTEDSFLIHQRIFLQKLYLKQISTSAVEISLPPYSQQWLINMEILLEPLKMTNQLSIQLLFQREPTLLSIQLQLQILDYFTQLQVFLQSKMYSSQQHLDRNIKSRFTAIALTKLNHRMRNTKNYQVQSRLSFSIMYL